MNIEKSTVTALLVILILVITTITICYSAERTDDNEAISSTETEASATSALATVEAETTTVQPVVQVKSPFSTPAWEPDEEEARAIAKTLYRECRGVQSKAEQAAVAWCILNRVDSNIPYFPDTIIEVLEQPHQFAYDEESPVTEELVELAKDVLTRWHSESEGDINAGRTIPREYVYFIGDGTRNHFSIEWKSTDYWCWELPNPYES